MALRLVCAACLLLGSAASTGHRSLRATGARLHTTNISGYLAGTLWKEWYKNQNGDHTKNASIRAHAHKHNKSDPQVHLIRIQKTGGTMFGERIMPKFCGGESRWCSFLLHSEWQGATRNGLFHGTLVVLLRHPVERTISEFFYLRGPDGFLCATQPQWDFRDTKWLESVQRETNIQRAFWLFFEGTRANPARNRQSLYLIGFDRDSSRPPGATYDWDGNRTELLALAKSHLERTVLGITDCYEPSVRAITAKLGWNTTRALELAETKLARKTEMRIMKHLTSRTHEYPQVTDFLNRNMTEPVSEAWNHSRPEGTWRSFLPAKLVNYIENWNSVDMELYEYALKLFQERYGELCL